MSELIFYTNPMSRGRIARWMLEEVGVPYRTEILRFETSMKSPAYRLINPMAKVPAIKHGDTIVTEAAAICAIWLTPFPVRTWRPHPSHAGSITAGCSLPQARWKWRRA